MSHLGKPITVLSDGAIFSLMGGGGIARYFKEIWRRVPARAPEIRFVLDWPAAAGPAPAGPGLSVVRGFQFRPGRLFIRWNAALHRRALRAVRADIFHSTYYAPAPVPVPRVVVTAHDLLDEHFHDGFSGNPRQFRLQLRQTLARADAVVAVSETTRADVIRFAGVAPDRVVVCPHGVSPSLGSRPAEEQVAAFRARHRLERPYLLYVGRHNSYKNLSTLIEGWRLLRESGRTFQLCCVGDDAALPPHLADYVARHRLASSLRPLPRLDDAELAAAYAGASAFVFPSLWEGFGLPIIEAAAAGCPLVLSDIPAFREVAGERACFFDPCSPVSLADALSRALADREHPRWTKQELAGRFDWDASAEAHAALFRRLMAT
ncbi:MAG: glycosyltransferase family 4 protein [Opitutaceae bacterium]|jgi:glycosyltransferase involved in cell wall biosynthesis|nr:glycosyltransferase family 4 protein [Opitutaceae bacterium]